MSTRPKATLTRFLTALAHSPELLEAFYENPAQAAEPWGLDSNQIEALQSGNLTAIQEAVQAEMPAGASALVGYWVTVTESQDAPAPTFRIPDWWIFF